MLIVSNLALRFLLELAGLAALGLSGFQLFDGPARWAAAVAAPAALALVWMLVIAPKASNGLPSSVRELIGSALLLAAAGVLALAGQPRVALVFAALVVANTVLLTVLGRAGHTGKGLTR